MTEPQDIETPAEYEAPAIEDVNDGGIPLAAVPGQLPSPSMIPAR